MDEQLEEPLKDIVYVVVLEMDCDGYDTVLKVYPTLEAAKQGMADWYSEEWDYWLDNDRTEEELEEESYLEDKHAYLSDCNNFWYTWNIVEEEVIYG